MMLINGQVAATAGSPFSVGCFVSTSQWHQWLPLISRLPDTLDPFVQPFDSSPFFFCSSRMQIALQTSIYHRCQWPGISISSRARIAIQNESGQR